MHNQKPLINRLSRSKVPKTQKKLRLLTCEKISGLLFYCMGIDISSHNNAANLGSFAKVSVSVQFSTPCIHQEIIDPTGAFFVCL